MGLGCSSRGPPAPILQSVASGAALGSQPLQPSARQGDGGPGIHGSVLGGGSAAFSRFFHGLATASSPAVP